MRAMEPAVSALVAVVLSAAAALKLRDRRRAASGLATYGIRSAHAQRTALVLIALVELCVAALLIAGAAGAGLAAAALFGIFACASAFALLAGRGGRPCACFAAGSTLSWLAPLRAGALAGLSLATARGWLPAAPTAYDGGLTIALTLAGLLIAGLGVALIALAREVAVLRLSLAGHGALEIAEEGPPLGAHAPWAARVPHAPGTILGVAIFSSEGCPMCRRLAPAVAYLAADPLLAVAIFDEHADAELWREAGVPGSPYAVALDSAGVVLAKGTYNSLAQLESIVATARSRESELALAA